MVAALLEDDFDPKEYVDAVLPSALEDAWQEIERRTRLRVENAVKAGVRHGGEWIADHAHDIATGVAHEVAVERGLDKTYMWKLQSMASRFKL